MIFPPSVTIVPARSNLYAGLVSPGGIYVSTKRSGPRIMSKCIISSVCESPDTSERIIPKILSMNVTNINKHKLNDQDYDCCEEEGRKHILYALTL